MTLPTTFKTAFSMNSKMLMSRDKSSLLASRDKYSIVRSFQDTLRESQRKSRQKASRMKGEIAPAVEPALTARAIFDAEKLAKDAGGEFDQFYRNMSKPCVQ